MAREVVLIYQVKEVLSDYLTTGLLAIPSPFHFIKPLANRNPTRRWGTNRSVPLDFCEQAPVRRRTHITQIRVVDAGVPRT